MTFGSATMMFVVSTATISACGRSDLFDAPASAPGTIPIVMGEGGSGGVPGGAGSSPVGIGGSAAGATGNSVTDIQGGGSPGAGSTRAISETSACDPIAQQCAAGLRCDLSSTGPLAFVCVPDGGGSGGEGHLCQDSSQDCVKGTTCLQPANRRGSPIGPGRCFAYCNTAADCSNGNGCAPVDVLTDGGGGVRVGICAPQ
jgi:hypothetical protein